MIFAILVKITISIKDIYQKNFENHMKAEFVKSLEFTQVIIFVIFSQKLSFRLKKWKFCNFSDSSLNMMENDTPI